MSIRKRTWKNHDGSEGVSWIVDYTDQSGKRRNRNFKLRRDAEAYYTTVANELRLGLHVADNESVTVAQASKLWFEGRKAAGLERGSLHQYRAHLDHHIIPFLGSVKLSRLTVPMVRVFGERMAAEGRSKTMVRITRRTLGSILADAQERGLVGQNVVRGLRIRRDKDARVDQRQRGSLKAGVDIPTPEEIRAIIAQLHGRWRPLILTAIFTGLRASELRGLRWADVDLEHGELHVRQRADNFNAIGPPKSKAGERTIPLLPMLISTLRAHRLACEKGELDIVFPSRLGGIGRRDAIITSCLHPAQVKAGVVDRSGKPKYAMHALRHFYASWCINRRVDGGLELPLKVVQARLGHSSITMTADTYGHIFPRGDDRAELEAAEKSFFGNAARK